MNCIKKVLIFFMWIVLFIPNNSIAQNNIYLTTNSGFELYTRCLQGLYHNSINGIIDSWTQASSGTVDYYNSSCIGATSVPKNYLGYQVPTSLNGYIGLLSLSSTRKNYREYIQNNLSKKLNSNAVYYFEYKVSLAESSGYCANLISIDFHKRRRCNLFARVINKKHDGKLFIRPDSSDYESFTSSWLVVSGYYQAKGGEKYLILGNFYKDKYTVDHAIDNRKKIGENSHIYTYIDDVFLLSSKNLQKHIKSRMQDSAVNYNFISRHAIHYNYRWDTVAFDAITKDTSWCSSIDTSSQLANKIGHYIQNDSVDSVFIVNYYSSGECEFVRYTNSLTYANSIKKWIKSQRPNLYCEAFGLDGNPNSTKPATGKVLCRTELLLKKRLGEKDQ